VLAQTYNFTPAVFAGTLMKLDAMNIQVEQILHRMKEERAKSRAAIRHVLDAHPELAPAIKNEILGSLGPD